MRRAAVLLLALLALAPATAEAAGKRCGARSVAARCLAQLRGAEPLRILPSGRIPTSALLQAFSETYGQLPGVRLRPGATGPMLDSTPVLLGLRRQRRSLTPRQRRAVDRRLAAVTRGARRAPHSAPTATARAQWQALVEAAVKTIEPQWGGKLQLPVRVELTPASGGDTYAQTDTVKEGKQRTCRIVVFPLAWDSEHERPGTTAGAFIAAHEVFHCFQFAKHHDLQMPPWYVEGSANWVAGKVLAAAGRSAAGWPTLRKHWAGWLEAPQLTLFSRDYSAIGFFAQLETSGTDVWPLLRQMLADNSAAGEPVYALAGTGFLATWGPDLFREPSFGPGWDLQGPSITGARPDIDTTPVGDGQVVAVTAKPRSAAVRTLVVGADVVEVRASGAFGRLRDAGGKVVDLADGAYCAREDGCAGRPAGCPELPLLRPGAVSLGVAANAKPATVTLRGRTLAQECQGKAGGAPGSATSVVVSGAASATFATDGACDGAPKVGDRVLIVFAQQVPGTTNGIEQLTFRLEWAGPGHYAYGHDNTVGYKGPGDTPLYQSFYDDDAHASSFGLDVTAAGPSGMTGTVSGTLRNTGDEAQPGATVSGPWRCAP